jgi:hypothetical protein
MALRKFLAMSVATGAWTFGLLSSLCPMNDRPDEPIRLPPQAYNDSRCLLDDTLQGSFPFPCRS